MLALSEPRSTSCDKSIAAADVPPELAQRPDLKPQPAARDLNHAKRRAALRHPLGEVALPERPAGTIIVRSQIWLNPTTNRMS